MRRRVRLDGVPFELFANIEQVDREAKVIGGLQQPLQMPSEKQIAAVGLPQHRFEQIEGRRARGERPRLDAALPPFVRAIRVGDDSAADAVFGLAGRRSTSTVRIATLNCARPPGSMKPIVPV